MLRILHAFGLAVFAIYLTIAALAQPTREQQDTLLERSVENRSRITSLESRVQSVENQGFGERLARMETKVEQIEWYVRLVIGGVVVLIIERLWGLVAQRKRKDDED